MGFSWRSVGVIGAGALVLSGCGGGSGATWSGTPVSEPDKALESIEQAWKVSLANADVKVRTADDSRCYFQATESDGKKILGDKVLCGPYRRLGSDATSWDIAPVVPVGSEGDAVKLGVDQQASGSSPFDEGKGQPNLVPWRPDGAAANLSENVDEPDAPKAAAGTVLENVTMPQSGSAVTGEEIVTPTGRYATTITTASRIGDGENRKQAPDGGTFVIVQAAPAGDGFSNSSSATGTTTLSVRAGGKDYPVTLPSQGGATSAVAVSGDGKDATVTYTYDGLSQSLDAAGKRVGTKAAGYYLPVTSGTSPDIRAQLGTTDPSAPGWHGSATLRNVTVQLMAYDDKRKWAPDGTVWARLRAGYYSSGITFRAPDSLGDSYRTTPTLKSVSLGGVSPTDLSFSESTGVDALFQLPADAEARSLKLKAVVNESGPVGPWPNPKAPTNANATYTFDGTVSLQK